MRRYCIMKTVFRAIAFFLLIAILTGCSPSVTLRKSERLAFLAPPVRISGTLEYKGEIYHSVLGRTGNGDFSLLLSGEGPLSGFGFLRSADTWRISCGDAEYPCPVNERGSLAGTYYTFVSLTADDLASAERSKDGETCKYSKNGTDFTLTFDSSGTLVRMETENTVFTPESFNKEE